MKTALVLFGLLLVACGGTVTSPPSPVSESTSSEAGAAPASRADGGNTCSPRPGCTSRTHCSDPCVPGSAWAAACECVRGAWQCGSNECAVGTPKPAEECPATATPKEGAACTAEGLSCDYGECQPQCKCEAGKWSCSTNDCVPPQAVCPPVAPSDGDACPQILAKCGYPAPADRRSCTCSIDKTWSCVPLN